MNKQSEIRRELRVASSIAPKAEIEKSIQLMVDYVNQYDFVQSLVLGISGGQDSTLMGRLAQLAVERLRDSGRDVQFIAVRLPYGVQADDDDATKALDFIQPDVVRTVNIKPAVDAQVESLEAAGETISDYNKGNIKARQRMITQYAIAGAHAGVVLGTDHAAEAVTGFYTKFGDGAADLTPIWRLNKRQGRAMLEALDCPPELYEKIPMADLEEDKPQQPDEEALGVTYEAIDNYLEGKVISASDAEIIEQHYMKSAHKRHLPITVFDDWWRG